jgi:hypothetical protein
MNPTTEPVCKMLAVDLLLQTLDPNYAPVGLLEMVEPAPKRVLDKVIVRYRRSITM